MASESDVRTLDQLTAREREVQQLLRLGLTDAQIAQRLGISAAGVSYHVSEIIGKLGVRNRYQAAAWPERPPWWASALAPVALFWRRAGAALPVQLSSVALALSGGLFVAALLGLGFMAFLLLRDGGGGEGVQQQARPNGLIEIPGSAIAALTNYTFTTDLEISSAQGDLQASLDGVFEAPDKFQGKLRVSGQLAKGFGRPAETEVIAIGDRVWWREPNGAWQPGILPGELPGELGEGSVVDPFFFFNLYATPRFYLEGLDFDYLRLSTSGSVETLNGLRAYPVRLDKTALIGMLDQGTFAKEAGKDVSIVREDAEAFLPEDIIIETWIAEDGRYPARLVVTLSSDESDGFSFLFEKPFDIRLEMDITDPDADVKIEPPS